MTATDVSWEIPRRAAYLGADRSGAEFWLSGPHVFSVPADGSRTRPVCGLARFNRREGCRRGRRSRPHELRA